MSHKRNILTVLVLSTTPALASPHQPPDDSQVSQALLNLRADLYHHTRAEVHADMPRFRALCDAEGYPLVGNIATKGSRYDPSDYCADVRAAAKK